MLFLIFFLLGVFISNLVIVLVSFIICYILTGLKYNLSNYHFIVAKYFYFLTGIFISYLIIAFLKQDIYIFLSNLKYCLLLTIKILLILLCNFYFKNNENLKKRVPKFFKVRIQFINFMFNKCKVVIRRNINKYKNKKEIIKNIDQIIIDSIIEIIKPYIAISKKFR